jgi:SRSO17 transposase
VVEPIWIAGWRRSWRCWGRKTRRTWAPLYLRRLLGPGERKSLQPMAARLGIGGHDQLQHFIASSA